jgi:V8-like Glu-specific endopeptidase
MRLRPGRPAVLFTAVSAAVATGVALSPPAGSVEIRSVPFGQTSMVGALFTVLPGGKLGGHFCTASVVDSPSGNLVITAAHCVQGRTLRTMAFVPDYSDGHIPYGTWNVRRVVVDQSWSTSSDPDDDFAFLVVGQPGTKISIQQITGGELIAVDAAGGRTVEVAGYPDAGQGMISCENTALDYSPTQFQFDCGGFTDGTSGSPLLANVGPADGVDTVIGVIGGYEQGGDTAAVSYAAKFNARLAQLYQTAIAVAGRIAVRHR